MIKALIFDFDGLILDTEMPIYLAWQEIYQEHGCELPLDLWAESIGSWPGIFDPAGYLQRITQKEFNCQDLITHQDFRSNSIINQQMAMPGVESYIQAAKSLGLKLAVASSSENEWVLPHLERIHLLDYFDIICTSNHVKKVKPEPDLFLCAVKGLAIQPAEAIVFEDSRNGIIAAKAAGCPTIAVPNQVTRMLDLSQADLTIPSMESIPLIELLEKFSTYSNH